MEQLGFIGLIEAAKGFDPDKGVKFSTYASVAIKGHISRGLRISSPWEKRSDNESELCHVISAHKLLPGSSSTTYIDMIEDKTAENAYHNMIVALDLKILRNDIFEVLGIVFSPKEREKNAIILKYGLNGKEHTTKEIASIYKVTQDRARELIKKGFRCIKQSRVGILLKEKYLVEYDLAFRSERLTRLRYKDPVFYSMEMEYLHEMMGL